MVKLELYIRQITRFLRTVTIKNDYFAEQMLNVWVRPEYRDVIALKDHPYYRHMAGNYILSEATFEKAREQLGIPTKNECSKIETIIKTPSSFYITERQSALSTFEECKILLNRPMLRVEDLNDAIIDYLYSEYGLTKYVTINGVRIINDMVYKKFDNVPVTRSFDTKKKIPFTNQVINNKRHRKTRATYKIPSSYYDKLITEYENEKDIIKNILYPVLNIQDAYAAENFSILACDLTLLEEDERTSMYSAMVNKLAVIKRRWDVSQFTYENLYAVSMQAKIWTILTAELFKQRIENIRTSEVHSFHLWSFLTSHGIADFSDILTRKQALFLYKNWLWLFRHRGSDHNLILLTHKLLYDHHLTTHDKVILQNNTFMRDDYKTLPETITGEIQQEILERLRTIERNDDDYLNKLEKAADELKAFDYTRPDATQIALNSTETVETTFKSEQKALLEYQEDVPFELSTKIQKKQFTYTPHTNFPTKLLELKKRDIDDIFAKLYIRFVTESLLYNIAKGYADDVLKLEYGEISTTLSVKDLLILFLYCEGQLHGYFTKIEKGKTKKIDCDIPTLVYLTIPYKKEFNDIQDIYHWWKHNEYDPRIIDNIEQPSPYVLNIIPEVVEVTSTNQAFPNELKGLYTLVNKDKSIHEWQWVADDGSYFKYELEGRWTLHAANGITLYNHDNSKYWNWLYWDPTFYFADESNFHTVNATDPDAYVNYSNGLRAEFFVRQYHYRMHDAMPNYETYMYYDEENPNESLVHLIDKQAEGYVSMYKEYLVSSWARQHSGFLEILDSRTFNGVVNLNLSPYKTFKEHFDNSYELSEIVKSFDYMSDKIREEEFKYLADTIVKLLYPIQSDYLIDSNLSMVNTFSRLKDLIVNMCSYNVAWVVNDDDDHIINVDCTDRISIDVLQMSYGFDNNIQVDNVDINMALHYEFLEKWCFDDIIRYKYKKDSPDSFMYIVYEPEEHICADHQYIFTDDLDSVDTYTQTADYDVSPIESSIDIVYGIVDVLNIPDMDHLREHKIPTANEINREMEEFLESYNFGGTIPAALRTTFIKSLASRYHTPFEEYAFTSEDVSVKTRVPNTDEEEEETTVDNNLIKTQQQKLQFI